MIHTIEVTEDDIRIGKVGDCKRCPVALAAARYFPGKWIYVDGIMLDISDEFSPISEIYFLPSEARQFIGEFDNDLSVQPFSFIIDTDKDKFYIYKLG